MLCLVRYLFVISTSVIDCLGRFVPEMTYYMSSGMLNLAQLNPQSKGQRSGSHRDQIWSQISLLYLINRWWEFYQISNFDAVAD